MGEQKRGSRPRPSETQELRERRAKRYQKRRAILKGPHLNSEASNPLAQQPLRSPSKPSTVLGQTQTKQVRRQQRAKQNSRGRTLGPTRASSRVPESAHFVPRRRQPKPTLQVMRLLVSGMGVALIAGFVIALMHPESPESAATKSGTLQFQTAEPDAPETVQAPPSPAYEEPGKELRQLKQEIRGLVEQQPDLTTGLFFLNPETQEFVTHRGSETFPAASMIKLPVLIAFFQDVDNGKIQLDEELVMRPDLIVGEAGAMQYDEPNSRYEALQVADWMITISDNTATNMIIDRLGGQDVLNQRFEEWGMPQTKIKQPLPDLEGMNTMSPKDIAVLMGKVSQGEILTAHSRDRALEILRHTVTNTLLPQGIGEGALIAHKTGDIGMAVGDAGLIDMPNGQRYVAGVVVKRPHNDPRAQELIRSISRLTYKTFSERPVPRPKPAAAEVTAAPESSDGALTVPSQP